MQHLKSGNRFAKALFDLALENASLQQVAKDMALLHKTLKENRDLQLLYRSPVVKSDKKLSITEAIFGDKLGTVSMGFIRLIIQKHREAFLEDISAAFEKRYNAHMNIEKATMISAAQPDDALVAQLSKLIAKSTGAEVMLQVEVKPELLGGFILQFANRQIDASLQHKINQLRQEFSKNLYIKDF